MPLDLDSVRSRLPGREIHWLTTIDSTMREAVRLAQEGCASGTVVGADEQTAGYGRYGRAWHSETDAGLYLTVILRLTMPPDSLPLVTLALGLAVAEAISETTDLNCDLRWPNDLLVNGKKCCGILTQLDGAAILAGVGINVNHAAFPGELADIATSLRLAAGRRCSREDLLTAILPSIDAHIALLEEDRDALLEAFSQASSYVRGRQVTVDQEGTVLHGVTDGLTPGGFLIVRDREGRRHVVLAGGVRPG